MRSSKSKHKARSRSGQKRPREFEGLQQKLQAKLGVRVRFTSSSDGVKMSEVLEKFVEPYLKFAETEESFRKLIMIAVVAWNASLLPKESQEEMIDSVLEALPPEVRAECKAIVKELMKRKSRYFAEFRRAVIGFEVRDTGKGFHLEVASTPENV